MNIRHVGAVYPYKDRSHFEFGRTTAAEVQEYQWQLRGILSGEAGMPGEWQR